MSESTTASEQPTEPTFSAPEATDPIPVDVPDEALKAYAPRFLAVSSFMGKPGLFIQWGEPNEGAASAYTITASTGQTITVGGDQRSIELNGLTPGTEVSISVKSKVGTRVGTIQGQPVPINDYITQEG